MSTKLAPLLKTQLTKHILGRGVVSSYVDTISVKDTMNVFTKLPWIKLYLGADVIYEPFYLNATSWIS